MITGVFASGFGQKDRLGATWVTPDVMYSLGFYNFRHYFKGNITFLLKNKVNLKWNAIAQYQLEMKNAMSTLFIAVMYLGEII